MPAAATADGLLVEKPPRLPLRDRRDLVVASVAAFCAAILAVAVWGAPDGQRTTVALAFGLMTAVPLVVGAVAWPRRGDSRFPRLLVAAAALYAVCALARTHYSGLYSAGRIAAWAMEVLIVFLALSFPSGRLASAWDRRVAVGTAAMVGLLWVPTVPLVPRFPEPGGWVYCGTDCPSNAFSLLSSQPAVIDDLIRPLRELLSVLLFVAVVACIARRLLGGGPLLRRTLAPVLAIMAIRVIAFAVFYWERRSGPLVAPEVRLLGWVNAAVLPALALSFAAGLVARRLHVATTLQRLARGLRAPAGGAELRDKVARSLEDPSVRVLYRLPDGWVDESGARAEPPRAGRGRAVTEVRSEARLVAAIVHDESLGPDPVLVQAAVAYALAVQQSTRVIEELQTSMQELAESRARLVSAADAERRRIERDLHDGAQQRLTVLSLNLGALAERLAIEAPARAPDLLALTREVEATIADVRSISHGVYPTLLARAGLVEALRVLASSAPLRTTVIADGVDRQPAGIESTVYFACVEALHNAVKHAAGATGVVIELSARGSLRFEVRDDGPGFRRSDTPEGSGMANMRDRLAAVGGSLSVESANGSGTRVIGVIPQRPLPSPASGDVVTEARI